jgi:aspartyl-tRNA(Asn)/glutamyl-tRNA(Gln) amidotransferase subunit A
MKEHLQSYQSARQALDKGQITCRQVVEYYLDRIEKHKHLNAFLEVYDQQALAAADQLDSNWSKARTGKLAGLVVGLKDVICYEGHGLQASSKILQGFESQFSATAVERLLEQGAIVIGRQNCDEFAMGSGNENSAFGPVKHHLDNERVPGGSSGGSAVSVAADLCMVSLGSDTGGSVRQPAAFCGIVGLKPTYSRISRWGLIAYASSFDSIGIFAKNVEDTALVLEVIAGADEFDSTVSRKPVPPYSELLKPKAAYKLAYIKETLDSPGLQPEIKTSVLKILERLKSQGFTVEEVSFPLLEASLPTYYVLTTAEASTNLSRYDGVRYGYRSPNTQNLETMYKKTRSEGFGKEVQRRILLGTFVLSASYYDAYFTQAQKVRRLIKEDFEKLLSQYDFLISPTTPTTAYKMGSFKSNPLEEYLSDLYTVSASVAGLPAISVPIGEDQKGLPIGLHITASNFEEEKLLAFSNYVHQL